jgi:hypothetical protein
MSAKFLISGIIFCLLLLPESSATGVGVGFNIDNGLSQTGIFDVYDVGEDVWLNDETFADGFAASINEFREVGGAGDIIATQTFNGGHAGRGFSSIVARDANFKVMSQAALFPGGVAADMNGWVRGENADLSVESASRGNGESDRVSGKRMDFKGDISAIPNFVSAVIDSGNSDLQARSKTFERRNEHGRAVVSVDLAAGTFSLERLQTNGFGELFNMNFKASGSNINLNVAAENNAGRYAFASAWADSGIMVAHPIAWATDEGAGASI